MRDAGPAYRRTGFRPSVALALALGFAGGARDVAAEGRRAVLLSLDGAGERIVAGAIARGAMPVLTRLRESGATAEGVVTTRPAKTATGHAALFTGAWSDRNGISGNQLPAQGGSVLESEDGFSSRWLRAEPIWVTAARQGLDVVTVSAPQAAPFGPYLEERRFGDDYGRRLTLVDDYRTSATRDTVVRDPPLSPARAEEGAPAGARELRLEIAGVPLRGIVFDDPEDPRSGFDTLLLAPRGSPGRGIRLSPAPAGDPAAFATLHLPGEEGAVVHVRLFELSPDGKRLLVYATTPRALRSNRPGAARSLLAATGGFAGNGASHVYARGLLGPTLWQGGDGTAEARYLETAALSASLRARLNEAAVAGRDWDLLVTYLPQPDEALHVWLGQLEASRARGDDALARELTACMDRVMTLVDGYVASVVRLAGPGAVVAIGSDHGQIGSSRLLAPNAILAAAGLLALAADGRIDPARSRAVYHPGNSGFVLINSRARRGPVEPTDEESVRLAVTAALLGARDPATGEAPVERVLDARRTDLVPRIGGSHAGDLYIEAAPGYYATARVTDQAVVPASPAGVHLFGPDRPEMHNSFTVSGPGASAGAALGVIRQIDIAPTVAALIGIDPPADAQGSVLAAALERE